MLCRNGFKLLVFATLKKSMASPARCFSSPPSPSSSSSSSSKANSKLLESLGMMRNVGIMAHVDAGKTTTTERILFYAGVTRSMGEVHDGDTVTDFMPQERERGITIKSAATTFHWNNHSINLIDTPGHVDFTIEVERCLRVLDGAVALLDAVAGVEAQTETVWRQSVKHKVPKVVFVNKMDRDGADWEMCLSSLHQRLHATSAVIQLPITNPEFVGVIDLINFEINVWDLKQDDSGKTWQKQILTKDSKYYEAATNAREQLVEVVAGLEDDLQFVEKYVEHGSGLEAIKPEELKRSIRKLCTANTLVPVLFGSSLKNIGVQPLMDAIVDFLPSPLQVPAVEAVNKKNQIVTREPLDSHLCALAFKVVHDSRRGDVVYVRVYSGTLMNKMHLMNTTRSVAERPTKILKVMADDVEELEFITAGGIGAVVGLKATKTGDTLVQAHGSDPIVLHGLTVPPPVFSVTVEVESNENSKALAFALECLAKEDPSINVREDEETGQTILSGQGELHLDIIRDRLQREYKVGAIFGHLQIAYRESISEMVSGSSMIELAANDNKRIQVAISLQLKPISDEVETQHQQKKHSEDKHTFLLDNGNRLTFGCDPISPDHVEQVKIATQLQLRRGPILGMLMKDVHVTVTGMKLSDANSTVGLQQGLVKAMQEALNQATQEHASVLMEPVMKVEIVSDEKYIGGILSDLTGTRRGMVHDVNIAGGGDRKLVVAETPLAEMVGYATNVRSLTAGNASFHMTYSRHVPLLPTERDKVIAKIRGF